MAGADCDIEMMTVVNLECRSINFEDLVSVTRLHQRAFKDSALTKLGFEPIRRYYEWQLTGPHKGYFIGVFDERKDLLGFCFAGVFKGALHGFLQKNKRFMIDWILKHPWLLFNPLVIDRIKIAFHSLRKKKKPQPEQSTKNERSFGVLSIAVDPNRRGLGIGKMMMSVVEEKAICEGFNQLHLTVHPTNTAAIQFYESCGWKKQVKENEKWQGRMTKMLYSGSGP